MLLRELIAAALELKIAAVEDGTERLLRVWPMTLGIRAIHWLEFIIAFTVVIQQYVLRFEVPRK